MKKTSKIATILLVSLFALSFGVQSTSDEQTTIKVSASQPTEFDMYQEGNNISRKLKTPFELKLTKQNDRFIFKSLEQNTSLKVTLEKEHGVILMGHWPIVVLLVEQGKVTTFGME